MSPRVVVVLGYSDGPSAELHPVCAARLTRAAEIATADDVVVLSGWSRHPDAHSEAALMQRAWAGQAAELVLDEDARSTVENALNARDDIVAHGAREVVVVTSRWHAARAATAFRWLLRATGARVSVASPPEPRRLRATLRELLLWPLLPGQLLAARRRTTRVVAEADSAL